MLVDRRRSRAMVQAGHLKGWTLARPVQLATPAGAMDAAARARETGEFARLAGGTAAVKALAELVRGRRDDAKTDEYARRSRAWIVAEGKGRQRDAERLRRATGRTGR